MSDPTELNALQAEAVRHFEGPLLVIAGAGSGKTRVLTTRICHLVRERGVHPARILAVTFTNKAAGEMRSRVARMAGVKLRGMWIGTFHSIGARLLRRHADLLGWNHAFTVFDADDQTRLVKEALRRLPKGGAAKASAVRERISRAKQSLLTERDHAKALDGAVSPWAASPADRLAAHALPLYERALKERNAFDFDDLILWPVRLFAARPELREPYRERFSFVLIDEYQDTSHAQFRFVDHFGRGHGNIMAVGDPDQAIYGWRGADVSNILDFERSYENARTVTLEENYRSREPILLAANAVIRSNPNRPEKNLRAVREGGSKVSLLHAADDVSEAARIAGEIRDRALDDPAYTYRDFAILYRTNAQSRALESELLLRSVPYQVVGGVRFYERREIQDVIAYLRVVANPSDASAFARAVAYPRRGVGEKSRQRVIDWARDNDMPVLDACGRAAEIPGIGPKAKRALVDFARLIGERREEAEAEIAVQIKRLTEAIDLERELMAEGVEGEDRVRNVEELVAGADSFQVEDEETEEGDPRMSPLARFLQRISLLADVDGHDSSDNCVSLMTLHNAKGLEFPIVYITGAEEGLLPVTRLDDPDQDEEECRLFYVGITRAEDELTISWARRRRRGGRYMDNVPSRFVRCIPDDLLAHRSCGRGLLGPRFRSDGGGERSGRYGSPPTGYPAFGGFRRGSHHRRGGSAWTEPEDENQDSPMLVKGARVRHPHFGSGVVRALSGYGRDVRVEVEFEEAGKKTLAVRSARLEADWP